MTRYGIIEEIDSAKGLARVKFSEDGIVSGWLHVSMTASGEDKALGLPTKGEHVAVQLEDNADHGYISGSVYDENNPPPEDSATKRGMIYRDGTKVIYDPETHELVVENSSNLTITVDAGTSVTVKSGTSEVGIEPGGLTLKRGGESLKAILTDLLTQIAAETHPTAMGPSGPPLNVAAYNAIKARIPTLFK